MEYVEIGTGGVRRDSSVKVMFCVMAYVMMAMFSFLFLLGLLGVAGNFVPQYSWLLRGEDCYEQGWTPEQRATLAAFAHDLRYKNEPLLRTPVYRVECLRGVQTPPQADTWEYAAMKDSVVMPLAAAVDAEFREFVQSGKITDVSLRREYGSLAHVAVRLGHLGAARIFIEKGCPALNVWDEEGESLLTLLFANSASCSQEDVEVFAEWLKSRGENLVMDAAAQRCILVAFDKVGMLQKMMEYGLKPELWEDNGKMQLPFIHLVNHNTGLLPLDYLLEEGIIAVDDRRGEKTYLQAALECDEVSEKVILCLLGHGAQPDAVPESGTAENTPLNILLNRLASAESPQPELLSVLRILLQHGAEFQSLPQTWVNGENHQQAEIITRGKASHSK